MMYVHMPVAMYSLTIKILSNMETKLFFFIPRRSYTIQYINESMKSVDKCKRYSAFYPEKQELPHSLACVYWPVITSLRWPRVDTRATRQRVVYVYMSMAKCACLNLEHTYIWSVWPRQFVWSVWP